MRCHDLGEIAGPLLVFGGPYSNLQASRALIAAAEAEGIPRQRRLCTGDVLGYCADPGPTWDLVRAAAGPLIAGNVERQLGEDAEDCGCGFDAGSACETLSRGWYPVARASTHAGMRCDMAALPDVVTFTTGGVRAAMIHGGVTDRARFLWPTSPEEAFEEELRALRHLAGPVELVLAGHSGIAFERRVRGALWVNAGVIGMPPNDGVRGGEYVVLRGGRPEVRRLAYDATAPAAAMRARGLTQGYDAGLLSGCWPSQDILPPEFRRA